MAVTKELSRFVRDALAAGQSRDEISTLLTQSGWSGSEVRTALSAWSQTASAVPVPTPQSTVSARDFFVYTLTFGLLLFASFQVVALLHALIDTLWDTLGRRSRNDMRFAISGLIVTLPLYLWLTVRDRRAVTRDPAVNRSAIRKWLIYITLLATATVMLGVLIAVINSYLEGEFTGQFLAKAAAVIAVAGGVFLYYLGDVRKGDSA